LDEPLVFHGSKVDKDPQDFIDEVSNIVGIMDLLWLKRLIWALINSRVLLKYGLNNEKVRGWLMWVLLIGEIQMSFS